MVDNLLVDDTKFNLAKERGNSTVLRRYRVNNHELISHVVDFLYDELVGYYDLNGQRKSTVDKLRHHYLRLQNVGKKTVGIGCFSASDSIISGT